jgi:hypothetical protein
MADDGLSGNRNFRPSNNTFHRPGIEVDGVTVTFSQNRLISAVDGRDGAVCAGDIGLQNARLKMATRIGRII